MPSSPTPQNDNGGKVPLLDGPPRVDMEDAFPPLALLPYVAYPNIAVSLVYVIFGICLLHNSVDTSYWEREFFGDFPEQKKLSCFVMVFACAWLMNSMKAVFVKKLARSPELQTLMKDLTHVHVDSLWKTDAPLKTYLKRTGVYMGCAIPFAMWYCTGTVRTAFFFLPFLLDTAVGSVTNHFKDGLMKIVHSLLNDAVLAMLPDVPDAREALSSRPTDPKALRELLRAEAAAATVAKPKSVDWESLTSRVLTLHRNLEALMHVEHGSACMVILPAFGSSAMLAVFFAVGAIVVRTGVWVAGAFMAAMVYSFFALQNLEGLANITARFSDKSLLCKSGPPIFGAAVYLRATQITKDGCDRFLNVMQIAQPAMVLHGACGVSSTILLVFAVMHASPSRTS
mmetsp:Transcript_111153/g.346416  ORF Transcript_111153/g.346416 Transcript_111153/m.346416 type:complete len:398 (-) Transcript_111153:238-1431(-)